MINYIITFTGIINNFNDYTWVLLFDYLITYLLIIFSVFKFSNVAKVAI
jgi:hypothetical protein